MHFKKIISLVSTGSLLGLLIFSLLNIYSHENLQEAKATTTVTYLTSSKLPKTLNLNDYTNTEITNYYSSLNGLSSNELQGTNLLKNLREIIHNITYFNYNSLWNIYEITDRDWSLSPTSTLNGTYDASTNTVTNYTYGDTTNDPYVRALYRNYSSEYIETSKVKALSDHTSNGINREHVWPNSMGFSGTNNNQKGPAFNDAHHLMSGDGYINQTLHNNYCYGYVDTTKEYIVGNKPFLTNNYRGSSLFDPTSTIKVFQPQKEDRGNIARAIFYMAACYNNYSGNETISDEDPFLAIANEVIDGVTCSSTSTNPVSIGITHDLLMWHKEDPVDSFEIHRNNLICRNYQFNRNPFIDYPEWVDYIWGTASGTNTYDATPTGYVDLSKDVINGYRTAIDESGISISLDKSVLSLPVGNTSTLTATVSDNTLPVSWTSSDETVATVSSGTITGIKEGTAVITAKVTSNGKDYEASCNVTVTTNTVNVTGITLSESEKQLDINGQNSFTLVANILPENATNKNVSWTSSNTSVASVYNGTVTASNVGNATITVTTNDGKFEASCVVTVINTSTTDEGQASIVFANNDKDYTSALDFSTLYSNYISGGANYIDSTSATNATSKIYRGQNGLKFGTKDVGGTLSFALSSEAKTRHMIGVSIDTTQYQTEQSTLSIYINNHTTASYSFSVGDTTNNVANFASALIVDSIKITTSARGYIKSINFIYQTDVNKVEIENVALSSNNLSLDLNGNINATLSYTITPENATNKQVEFSSSNPEIATVDNNGLVTAIKIGTATIKVVAIDGGKYDECVVDVTDTTNYESFSNDIITNDATLFENKNATSGNSFVYKKTIATTDDLTINFEGINTGSSSGSRYSYLMFVKDYGYFYNSTCPNGYYLSDIKVNFSSTTGLTGCYLLTTSTSMNNVRATANGTNPTKSGTIKIANADETIGYFNFSTYGANIQVASIEYTFRLKSYLLDDYYTDFISSIICDANGINKPTFTSGSSWNYLKTLYNKLSTSDQQALTNITYTSEEALNGSNIQIIAAKYDYIVAKYGEANYENFMNRSIYLNSGNKIIKITNSQNYLCVILSISIVGASYYLLSIFRKKKR